MNRITHSKNSLLGSGFRKRGLASRLTMLVYFHALAIHLGLAAESQIPMPLVRHHAPAVAASMSRLSGFQKIVANEKSLLGYWAFSHSLNAANDSLTLQAGQDKRVFRTGPLGIDSSIDLSNGAYMSLGPCEGLNAAELSVELIFKIKYPTTGAIFGIRDGKATRFSLHYAVESRTLKLWNGTDVTNFEADTQLKMGEWYHLAFAVSGTESILWINGKRCVPSAASGMGGAKGLPFLLGTTDLATGHSERAEILAAHLAIYKTLLGDEAVTSRMKALGWGEKLKPMPRRSGAEEIARIDSRINRIKEEHGVDVHYKFVHEEFIPAIWHSVGKGTQLPLEHVPMVLDEIDSFLEVVPKEVSVKDLDHIYIFGDLKIGDGAMGAMAYGKSIYLCCMRPAIDIRYSLFHELGHILQVAYPVDDKLWTTLLPENFKYGQNTQSDPFGYDERLRSDGFVINYSTWNRHEDICVLSDYLFVRKDQTLDLMESYPAIKRKAAALVNYYKDISPEYDFTFYDAILKSVNPPVPDISLKP